MATVPTQVRIDEELKKQSMELFAQLGIDMSSAMNMFLKQCVMRGGLPFAVEIPQYRSEVLEAMEEARSTKDVPTAIIMKTVKGKGVSYMEDQAGWHGKAPNDEQYELAMEELGKQLAELEVK